MSPARRSGPPPPEGRYVNPHNNTDSTSSDRTEVNPQSPWAGREQHDAQVAAVAKVLGEQLTRRRDAALRLPPLANGRRDPLGPVTDGRWP
jgi:hypothetical protein